MTALSDTLRTVTNERGEIESSRLVLVQERDDLKLSNLRLADRIGRIKGDLDVALSALAEAESRDTTSLVLTDPVLVDTSGSWSWTYDPVLPAGNRLLIEGRSGWVRDSAWTEVTRHLVAVDLVLAIRKRDDGLREAVATSSMAGASSSKSKARYCGPTWCCRRKTGVDAARSGSGSRSGWLLWEAVR